MDVHDPHRELADEIGRDEPHEPREDDDVHGEIPAVARVHEALEVRAPPGREHPDPKTRHRIPQCLNSRVPVKTMAIPDPSAAAMTSASRIEPPGCAIAATPPFANSSRPSRNGK